MGKGFGVGGDGDESGERRGREEDEGGERKQAVRINIVIAPAQVMFLHMSYYDN